jgi:hypothetical protein
MTRNVRKKLARKLILKELAWQKEFFVTLIVGGDFCTDKCLPSNHYLICSPLFSVSSFHEAIFFLSL